MVEPAVRCHVVIALIVLYTNNEYHLSSLISPLQEDQALQLCKSIADLADPNASPHLDPAFKDTVHRAIANFPDAKPADGLHHGKRVYR
jgi:hypothetical protein